MKSSSRRPSFRKVVATAVTATAMTLLTTGCEKADDPETATVETEQTLASALSGIGEVDEAAKLIKAAGLEPMFEQKAAYTLFLPSNAALATLADEERERLNGEEARPELIALLRQHIVPGAVSQKDLEAALVSSDSGKVELASVAKSPLSFSRNGETIVIGGDGGPVVSLPPKAATNGVIYVISGLVPPQN